MIFGAINSLIQSGKQKKQAARINPVNTEYNESGYIKELYGSGKNLYQGRMAGASQAEQNILSNQSNVVSNAQRNATDASQLLSIAGATQGQADQSFANLATAEAQDKQRRFGIYSNVSQLMAEEGNKVYQDKLRRYYDDLNYKRGLEGASMQNLANAWGGLDNAIGSAVSMFTPGGILAGGGGGGNQFVARPTNNYTRNPVTDRIGG